MTTHVEDCLAIGVPDAGIVDLEIALVTERTNQLLSLRHDLMVGLWCAVVVQIVDLCDFSGILSLENKGVCDVHMRPPMIV